MDWSWQFREKVVLWEFSSTCPSSYPKGQAKPFFLCEPKCLIWIHEALKPSWSIREFPVPSVFQPRPSSSPLCNCALGRWRSHSLPLSVKTQEGQDTSQIPSEVGKQSQKSPHATGPPAVVFVCCFHLYSSYGFLTQLSPHLMISSLFVSVSSSLPPLPSYFPLMFFSLFSLPPGTSTIYTLTHPQRLPCSPLEWMITGRNRIVKKQNKTKKMNVSCVPTCKMYNEEEEWHSMNYSLKKNTNYQAAKDY